MVVPPGGAGIGMHVIPVEKAIEMENQSVPVEHISHWLDKYEELSFKTCIFCGEPATQMTTGWILPVCDSCYR